jgi:hypothetical protein
MGREMVSSGSPESAFFADLYMVEEDEAAHAFFAEPSGALDEVEAVSYGTRKPSKPLGFRQAKNAGGTTLCDWIFTGLISPKLVSDRVVQGLRDCNIAGWNTYEVRLKDRKGSSVAGYRGLIIEGRSGPLDHSKCRVVERVKNGHHSKEQVGLWFSPTSWDRSDVFVPEGTDLLIVTSRAARCLNELKVKNLQLVPLNDFRHYVR